MLLSTKSSTLLAVIACIASVHGLAFNYGAEKVRGVTLGGWLVLDAMITPSLFEATQDCGVVDEWTYGEKYGSEAGAKLRNHWDTFITEADVIKIKSYGLNHVRIPFGFWSVKKEASEPYAVGAYEYVKKAVDWCKKHGLKVMLGLHGVPGGQNGFDSSGQRDVMEWHTDDNNVRRTREVLKIIIDDFIVNTDYRDTVTAIQPITEPNAYAVASMLPILKQYYYDAYGALRWPYGNGNQADTLLVLHDAFEDPAEYWKDFMPYNSGNGWSHVSLDTHPYTIYSDSESEYTPQQRIDAICQMEDTMTKPTLWTLVGEWSVAPNDCAASTSAAPASMGSFFDGSHPASNRKNASCSGWTGSAATFSPAMKTFMRQYWETQANIYERGIGWIMFTWKTEKAEEWSYEKGVENGWIPKDPRERQFSDLCKTRLPATQKMLKRGLDAHAKCSR